ncbi:MAG: S-methyl-5-thioribose kinase [Alphaproteobacteria bacterium]
MEYYQLSKENLVSYLKEIPEMQKIFSSFDCLDIHEIGDGNLNFVFRVMDKNDLKKTVIVKQAVPFLRIAGEGWPLSEDRMRHEISALSEYARLCPGFVPEIYFSSLDMSVVIMQNLSNYPILRQQIIDGKYFPKLSEDISTFLANTLFYTSDLALNANVKKKNVGENINPELCKITEDFVFTNPYNPQDETNIYPDDLSQKAINIIQQNPQLQVSVSEMKYLFMTKAEALLHGDLHIGSVMAGSDATYVIDPEFSFYGPMGFDVGAFISNLYLDYFAQSYWQKQRGDNDDYQKWLLVTIIEIWEKFADKFERNWINEICKGENEFYVRGWDDAGFTLYRKQRIANILADTIGFASCKMMRRIVGLAKVIDITKITDREIRAQVEQRALKLGAYMAIHHRQFTSFAEINALAVQLNYHDEIRG